MSECPTRYHRWSTWELLDRLRDDYKRRPKLDDRGRLHLELIPVPPVPPEFHLELTRRVGEIRNVLAMERGELADLIAGGEGDGAV